MPKLWDNQWPVWFKHVVKYGCLRPIFFDQDCMAVVAAPLIPGEVFGAPSEAALEQSCRTRELTRSVR